MSQFDWSLKFIVLTLLAWTLFFAMTECRAPKAPYLPGATIEEGELHGQATPQPTPIPTAEPKTLQQFTSELMDQCKSKLSDARKIVLSEQITRIAQLRFPHRRSQQEAFVFLICIESAFQTSASSKVGAVGLTQVMPKYANAFAAECGLGNLTTTDLQDSEVNLLVGSCQFSKLLTDFEGNVALALAGYNSGQYSETTKKLSQLREGHPETMAYIAKYMYLREANK